MFDLIVQYLACNAGDPGSILGLGRCPGEGNSSPLQCSCLEKSHGQRSLAGYGPWGRTESDTAERLTNPCALYSAVQGLALSEEALRVTGWRRERRWEMVEPKDVGNGRQSEQAAVSLSLMLMEDTLTVLKVCNLRFVCRGVTVSSLLTLKLTFSVTLPHFSDSSLSKMPKYHQGLFTIKSNYQTGVGCPS